MEGFEDCFFEIGVGFDKGWVKGGGIAEHVCGNENLPITMGAATNSDQWDVEAFRDSGGDFGINHFSDDGEAAGILQGLGIFEQLVGFLLGFSKFAVRTQGMNSLGEQADVAEDGDACANEVGDGGPQGLIGFNFYCLCSALLHEGRTGFQGLGWGEVSVRKG